MEVNLVTNLYAKKGERLVVPISDEQKEQLRVYSKKLDVSMSMAARLILAEFFEKSSKNKLVYSKDIKTE